MLIAAIPIVLWLGGYIKIAAPEVIAPAVSRTVVDESPAPPRIVSMVVARPNPTLNYEQVGYLADGQGLNLPLYGRQLNRDMWQYYTASGTAQTQTVRLMIEHNGRSCANDYGCQMLYGGENLSIKEYDNKVFKVTIYPRDPVVVYAGM